MSKGMAKTPSTPRNPLKGSAANDYFQPARTSGMVRTDVRTSGRARMMNVSEVKPGMGTSGQGTKVRPIR